jgi:protein SCO1
MRSRPSTALAPARRAPAGLALATASALALTLAACGAGGSSSASHAQATAVQKLSLEGAVLPPGHAAASFVLTDQNGERLALSSLRGRPVVLTFLYSTCGATCVLIAQQIRGALDELSAEGAGQPAVLIVSADPAADTPATVRRFLSETSLAGRAHYLSGSLAQLRAIWRAYDVKPASAGRTTFAQYASVVLLDAQGRERVLFQSEQLTPEAIGDDIRKLGGDPTHP